MLHHALGNLNLHSVLITLSLNILSCPRQFQFSFSAPAVIRVFPECRLTPLAVSPAPAVSRTFPECHLMPLAVSPAPLITHSFTFPAPAVIRISPHALGSFSRSGS